MYMLYHVLNHTLIFGGASKRPRRTSDALIPLARRHVWRPGEEHDAELDLVWEEGGQQQAKSLATKLRMEVNVAMT